ncbi:MAG TPA: hypothetical protein VI854_03200 [Acidimicrobiia bacterium]|nr:hypothetical protein [Acidimicrobiia bacterium]
MPVGAGSERVAAAGAGSLPGVTIVLDTDGDRVADVWGDLPDDTLEIVLHFAGTWDELLGALLPVLEDALRESWTPARWWACAGGGHVAVGRSGRAVVVRSGCEGPLLAAVAGDGVAGGMRVW